MERKNTTNLTPNTLQFFTPEMKHAFGRDFYERIEPTRMPAISIKLTNVPTGRILAGKTPFGRTNEQKRFGFQLMVDGDCVNVVLGSTDQNILYAALLLGSLHGRSISKGVFDHREDPTFLHEVFRALAPDVSWDEWYYRAIDTHRIEDAKSKVNKALWEALCDSHPEAYYYCAVRALDKRRKDSRYAILLHNAEISCDRRFEHLLVSFSHTA